MNTASVYWLHLPNHQNILTEGYIGVTTNVSKRLNEHKRSTNNHLCNAFYKYSNEIICTILLKGSEEYCYCIENKLRPIENIGWNINQGGGRPPNKLGMKHPEESKKLMGHSGETNPMFQSARFGDLNPMYGKKHTIESKRLMSKPKMSEKYGKDRIGTSLYTNGTKRKFLKPYEVTEEWIKVASKTAKI